MGCGAGNSGVKGVGSLFWFQVVSGDFWTGFGCGMKGKNAGGLGEIGERIGSDFGRCLGSGLSRTKGKEILVFFRGSGERSLGSLRLGECKEEGDDLGNSRVLLMSGCWLFNPLHLQALWLPLMARRGGDRELC